MSDERASAKKILHVYQSPSFSGAEAYALEVASHQARLGDVTFLVKPGSPLEKRAKESSKDSNRVSSRLKVVSQVSQKLLALNDVIILHSTQELKYLWPRLAAMKMTAYLKGQKTPKVIVYTHIWISHSKKDPIHAIPYAVADEIWCSSEQSRRALIQFLPIHESKIKVVRYGRDIETFQSHLLSKQQARTQLSIPLDATVVGTLARVDKGKGSLELFEAVTDLMQSRKDLHFLMIGPPTDGDPKAAELDQSLEKSLAQLAPPIRSRVHKLGRLDGGSYYLSAFDLFILATYKENFALTLLEALCAKVPCLATDSGGSPDVVRPHFTGWLFLPESTESLRSTLLTALDQKEKWPELGANGQAFVTQNFSFQSVMKDLDQKL